MSDQNSHEQGNEPLIQEEPKDVHAPTADEIKSEIEADIQQVNENESGKDWASELKAVEDKYLRLYAEFDNYKRRTTAERIDLFKTAGQEMLVALLPVLDDFERALKAMETTSDLSAVKEGINLVNAKFSNILQSKGLKPMEAKGTDFNSDLHEAITNVPAPNDELKGKVIDEVEKGYYLHDKVIRFAKVVVGS